MNPVQKNGRQTENAGFACLDDGRRERTGYPEAVYCRGKTTEQAAAIITAMREKNIPVLATGAEKELADIVEKRCGGTRYDGLSRVLSLGGPCVPPGREGGGPVGLVTVVCAGTSDLAAAREALLTAEFYGSGTELVADVGIAGIHRLFARLPDLRRANVIIAAAGMEGALAGVVAGLVAVPVIALPTSVGYGASLGGVAALLAMLNSCSPGISVVNIDNGFGAGYLANLINQGFCGYAGIPSSTESGGQKAL
ncbi:MAG: nickel pincer cofactor biosynthesis protein LarB [Treponema sp.]|jgi:NCAIR mutase (PurE)-related protein|nr:nickel pincer cofactor biosynthesis protein LarB [Treponema sp.]